MLVRLSISLVEIDTDWFCSVGTGRWFLDGLQRWTRSMWSCALSLNGLYWVRLDVRCGGQLCIYLKVWSLDYVLYRAGAIILILSPLYWMVLRALIMNFQFQISFFSSLFLYNIVRLFLEATKRFTLFNSTYSTEREIDLLWKPLCFSPFRIEIKYWVPQPSLF